jgi:hypothetical protein
MRVLVVAGVVGLLFSNAVLAHSPGKHRHGHGHAPAEDDAHAHTDRKSPVRKAIPPTEERAHEHGVETENLFAFVSGSDIGERGERHFLFLVDGAFQKREGTFRAIVPKVELGYNPTDRMHIALELWADHFKVRNNPDFDDQNRWGGGAALEFKVLLLERGKQSPVGVAFVVAPHYGTSEHVSGEPADHYALEIKLIADAELVRDRVFAAINLLYEPEKVRPRGEPWEKESLFGASAAIMARFAPTAFAGAEIQYFRKYEGYFFETFAGHALYVGPALHLHLTEHCSLTLGWAIQVAGRAAGNPRSLDLVNFERQRGTLKFSSHF